ncbi:MULTISPECIES: MarC family protein [unclassified Sulfurospirillum]|jgi:multiple antibiotic resistance protein|uniref:MarC family protein n=1 Tax=unclassified Sulfurospirillum TaxID=2618290 RepID=UPI000501F4E7|nr:MULTISPECIES: MarC family protein [unclassified Sulfurospirillum]KFL33223.1 antibiotic resistance protein MarC [Sulfurospirillum sp. SCADC]
MADFFNLLLQHTITMMAIVDPLGVSAIMLSLLPQSTTKEHINKIAAKATMTIIVAFFVVLLTGNFLLNLFGIEIDSLKVMGGIILLLTAIKMVQGSMESKNQTEEEREEAIKNDEFSVIPLGVPITFGPGIFATIIILRGHSEGVASIAALVIAYLIVALSVYLAFKNSIYIRHYLGITGQKIVSRLMGLIVGAIAVQFIVGGVSVLAKHYM